MGLAVAGIVEIAEVSEIIVGLTAGAAALGLTLRSGRLTSIRYSRLRRRRGSTRQVGSRRLERRWCRLRAAFRLGRLAGARQVGSRRLLWLRHVLGVVFRLLRQRWFGDSCRPSGTDGSRVGLAYRTATGSTGMHHGHAYGRRQRHGQDKPDRAHQDAQYFGRE